MNESLHFCKFDEYCKTCKHFKLDENEDPCNECLAETVNVDSRKPVHYEEVNKHAKLV